MTQRGAVEAHTSVFPAKAGTQNLSHRREAAHRPPPCRWKEEQMSIEPPFRVIARCIAPKQPRGPSPQDRVSPVGCFAVLAMTLRGAVEANTSVFPAQRGSSEAFPSRVFRSGSPPSRGTRDLWLLNPHPFRVIARRETPKQPTGTSPQVRASPLGCFAALAMTRRSAV